MSAKEYMQQMLADGKNYHVMDGLKSIARVLDDPDFAKEVDLLSGRFNALKKDHRRGILEDKSYRTELNKIMEAAHDLVDSIPKSFNISEWPILNKQDSNAQDASSMPIGRASIYFDPTLALATGKSPPEGHSTDKTPNNEFYKHPCVLQIEQKLRQMANSYFDENGFERPQEIGASFVQSYMTLHCLKLKSLAVAIRSIDTDEYDFFPQVKGYARDLKKLCNQLSDLIIDGPCEDFPLNKALEKTVIQLELLDEELPLLITDRSKEKRALLKSNYLIPLADRIHQLMDRMQGIDARNIKAELN